MQAPAPTVYMVDDDPHLLKALQRLLQSAGLQATPFDSAQAFLDGHDRAAPGCLVLDLSMPGLNGLELQRELEQLNSPLRAATFASVKWPGRAPDDVVVVRCVLEPTGAPPAEMLLPDELVTHYRELLRTYVIMGSGTLMKDLSSLGRLLAETGLSTRSVMQLHLQALAELLQGLGTRSTRHVMSRADLLALEIVVHMAESYRHRYEDALHPPVQQFLPGFAE